MRPSNEELLKLLIGLLKIHVLRAFVSLKDTGNFIACVWVRIV